MDDSIREQLHDKLVPCTEQEFMDAYLAEDPDFDPDDFDYGINDDED